MEDQEIISLILKGQTNQYEKIVMKYQNLLYSIANSIVRDEYMAKDITQESFLKAFRYLQNRSIDNFKNFLCRLAYHQSIDYIRRSENLENKIDSLSCIRENKKSSAEEEYIKQEMNQDLHIQIEKLPSKYRLIISQYYFQNKSYAQIAAECGLRKKTVETRLYRARKHLKKYLLKEDLP